MNSKLLILKPYIQKDRCKARNLTSFYPFGIEITKKTKLQTLRWLKKITVIIYFTGVTKYSYNK